MPQLQIRLPTELGNASAGGQGRSRENVRSEPIGPNVEGLDGETRQILRWWRCWATGEG